MTKFKRTAILSAIAAPTLLMAQAASAVFIEEWDYEVDNGFSDFTPASGADGAVTGSEEDGFGLPTRLSWGTSDPQSSIKITSDINSMPGNNGDELITNGPGVAGGVFTHNNFDITDENDVSLESFVLRTRLNLTSAVPDNNKTAMVDTINFDSFFTETDNHEPCVEGSESTCDDIFVLSNELGESTDGTYSIAADPFTIDNTTYTVFLDIAGLTDLTDAQCTEADAGLGCVGFLTQENLVNEFDSSFRIVAVESVPEPGTLALLGVGLFGIGYARRRRNNG